MGWHNGAGWLTTEERRWAEECVKAVKIARAAARSHVKVRPIDTDPERPVRTDMASSGDYSGGESGSQEVRSELVGHEERILLAVLTQRLARLRTEGDRV